MRSIFEFDARAAIARNALAAAFVRVSEERGIDAPVGRIGEGDRARVAGIIRRHPRPHVDAHATLEVHGASFPSFSPEDSSIVGKNLNDDALVSTGVTAELDAGDL